MSQDRRTEAAYRAAIEAAGGAVPPTGHLVVPLMLKPPRTYLLWSLLCLLLFFPAGVFALVYSLRVPALWEAENIAAAKKSSRTARNWCIVATLVAAAGAATALLLSASYFAGLAG